MNIKNIAMWAIIVILTIGLYNMFKNPQANVRGGDKIIFSEFLTETSAGFIVLVFNWMLIINVGSMGVAAFTVVDYLMYFSLLIFYPSHL